jgi:hypothetical protein
VYAADAVTKFDAAQPILAKFEQVMPWYRKPQLSLLSLTFRNGADDGFGRRTFSAEGDQATIVLQWKGSGCVLVEGIDTDFLPPRFTPESGVKLTGLMQPAARFNVFGLVSAHLRFVLNCFPRIDESDPLLSLQINAFGLGGTGHGRILYVTLHYRTVEDGREGSLPLLIPSESDIRRGHATILDASDLERTFEDGPKLRAKNYAINASGNLTGNGTDAQFANSTDLVTHLLGAGHYEAGVEQSSDPTTFALVAAALPFMQLHMADEVASRLYEKPGISQHQLQTLVAEFPDAPLPDMIYFDRKERHYRSIQQLESVLAEARKRLTSYNRNPKFSPQEAEEIFAREDKTHRAVTPSDLISNPRVRNDHLEFLRHLRVVDRDYYRSGFGSDQIPQARLKEVSWRKSEAEGFFSSILMTASDPDAILDQFSSILGDRVVAQERAQFSKDQKALRNLVSSNECQTLSSLAANEATPKDVLRQLLAMTKEYSGCPRPPAESAAANPSLTHSDALDIISRSDLGLLESFAQYGKLDAELESRLLLIKEASVRRALAKNKSVSSATMISLLHHADLQLLSDVGQRYNLAPDVESAVFERIMTLSKDMNGDYAETDQRWRRGILGQLAARTSNEDILNAAAREQDDVNVAFDIATNDHASQTILTQLARSSSHSVRLRVASNANITDGITRDFAASNDLSILEALVLNPVVSRQVVDGITRRLSNYLDRVQRTAGHGVAGDKPTNLDAEYAAYRDVIAEADLRVARESAPASVFSNHQRSSIVLQNLACPAPISSASR